MTKLHKLWETQWSEITQLDTDSSYRSLAEQCRLVSEEKRDTHLDSLYRKADMENIEFYQAATTWQNKLVAEERIKIMQVLHAAGGDK
jgi:hypothetical protein